MIFTQYALTAKSNRLAGIVMLYLANSIFMRLLRFEETSEFSISYNRQASSGNIAFRGLNETYTKDTAVINPQVEQVKIFGGTASTDRQLAKGETGQKNRANNKAMKIKKAAQFFDKAVIKGDSSNNPREIDGLQVRLTGTQNILAAANGAQLTLDLLDNLLDAVVGPNSGKVLVMNKQMRTKTKRLILPSAGGAAVADFKNGELDSYNGAKIEVLDEDETELPILGFDETAGTDAATCSIYCVRPGTIDKEYLGGIVRLPAGSDPIDYVDYGERGGTYDELVEAAMGIALYHPKCAARLRGIKKPA